MSDDHVQLRSLNNAKVHCPHVGPKGGSAPDNYKCVNIDYVQAYFTGDRALFGDVLDAFSCPSR